MHGSEAALDMKPLVHSLLEVSLQRSVGVSATARVAHCAARVWVGAIEVRLPVVEAAVAQTSATTVSGKEKSCGERLNFSLVLTSNLALMMFNTLIFAQALNNKK